MTLVNETESRVEQPVTFIDPLEYTSRNTGCTLANGQIEKVLLSLATSMLAISNNIRSYFLLS